MASRRKGPSVEWKITVPVETARNIELFLYDPSTRKPDYGARSTLITKLLNQFWDQLPQEQKDSIFKPERRALEKISEH